MFSTQKMHHVRAYFPRSSSERLIDVLFEKGIAQLKIKNSGSESQKTNQQRYLSLKTRLEHVQSELDQYKTISGPSALKTLFSSKKPERSTIQHLSKEKFLYMALLEKILMKGLNLERSIFMGHINLSLKGIVIYFLKMKDYLIMVFLLIA